MLWLLGVAYKPEDAGDTFWLAAFVALFYGVVAFFVIRALIRRLRQREAFRMLRRDRPAGKIGSVHRARKHAAVWEKAARERDQTDERERTAG